MTTGGRCRVCGRDTLWIRTPRYEGFRRIGDDMKCASCGALIEADAVAVDAPARPSIFSEDELPPTPNIFADDESPRFCHRCRHYVVNPFRQWCGVHRRDVSATDTCEQFTPRQSDNPSTR